MTVIINVREGHVSKAEKHHITEKGNKLYQIFNGITKMEVFVGKEGQDHRVEVVLHLAKGEPLTTHSDHATLSGAVDLSMGQAKRVLTRHKDKIRDHHRGEGHGPPPATPAAGEDLESYQEVVDKTDFE